MTPEKCTPQLTDGASVSTNVALLESNAALAAAIASVFAASSR